MKKIYCILSLLFCLTLVFSGCSSDEKKQAQSAFNEAAEKVEENNQEIDKAISELRSLIDSGETPLDASLIDQDLILIEEAKQKIFEISDMPSSIEEIEAETEKLNAESNQTEILTQLDSAKTTLSDSIAQMKQLTNPSESFIIERITGLPNISGIEAVTEENDPNGNLNKQGGYTSAVYFSSDLVDDSNLSGNTIVERGTDGGGCIEVYSTVEDANTRNEYLAAFDGSMFSSGSHTVAGTVVIRTSDELTASQQKALESSIYNSLIELKE